MSHSISSISHISATPASHPSAFDGEQMALAAIMKCFDSTNGLSMAWDTGAEAWGSVVSGQAAAMNSVLGSDYRELAAYIDPKSDPTNAGAKLPGAGDPSSGEYASTISRLQLAYNQDQTNAQNQMQQSQSELDKESQTVKDLGTSTQSLMTNTSSLLSISSNLSQMMGRG